MNRKNFWLKLFAFSLLLLTLPTLAAAQWRNDNDDDDFYRNRRNSNYNRRYLVDAVRRVENDSRSFRRALDRNMDNSRYDESNREDRINDIAERFATAADNLEDSFDNGYNLNSSSDEARELFQLAARIDRFLARNSFDYNVENQWSNISRDLGTIANAYGYNFNRNNRRNDNWNNRRNRDNNRRSSDRRNGRWGQSPF